MKKQKNNKQPMPVVGAAWFKEEDWSRLLEISEDRDNLEKTHAEWLQHAEAAIGNFEKQGMKIQKIEMTPNELLLWCNERNIPVNGEARSGYATYKMQQKAKNV